MFYVAMDLDELDEVPRRLRFVSRNRWNLLSFRDDDHLLPPAARRARLGARACCGPRAWIPMAGRSRWSPTSGASATSSTRPASSSAAIAPASSRSSSSRSTTPTASGTCTCSAATRRPAGFVDSMEKAFYVSPFIEMAGRYTVRVRDEPARLRITINEVQDDGLLLHTSLDLTRRRLSDRMVAADAPAPSDGQPQDDRDDPLACPAAVAARGPIPSTWGGAHDDHTDDRSAAPRAWRTRSCPGSPGGSRRLRRIASRSGISWQSCRTVAAGRSATRPPDRRAEIHIHDTRALTKLLVDGETGGGEAYMDGLWSSPDLAGLLRWAALNRESLALSTGWFRAPGPAPTDARPSAPTEHEAQSRRNISAHYDLGNDFYRTFLDETMTYSSAVFESADQSLADAQREQVPAHGRRRWPGRRPARPRDRDRLGRVRPLRRRRARLPRDVRDDLEGTARVGDSSGSGPRACRTGSTSSCGTTATSPGRTTRSSRSRCSKP